MENILVFLQKRKEQVQHINLLKELKCFSNQNVPDFIIIFSSSGPVRSQIFTSEKKEKRKKGISCLRKQPRFCGSKKLLASLVQKQINIIIIFTWEGVGGRGGRRRMTGRTALFNMLTFAEKSFHRQFYR